MSEKLLIDWKTQIMANFSKIFKKNQKRIFHFIWRLTNRIYRIFNILPLIITRHPVASSIKLSCYLSDVRIHIFVACKQNASTLSARSAEIKSQKAFNCNETTFNSKMSQFQANSIESNWDGFKWGDNIDTQANGYKYHNKIDFSAYYFMFLLLNLMSCICYLLQIETL